LSDDHDADSADRDSRRATTGACEKRARDLVGRGRSAATVAAAGSVGGRGASLR